MGSRERKDFPSYKKNYSICSGTGIARLLKSFELFVHENKAPAKRVFAKKLGLHRCHVAYYSAQLDAVAVGNNYCVKAIAATAAVIKRRRPSVLGHPTATCVLHEVVLVLEQHATQTLFPL